jgi:hypothetical protein
VTFRREFGLPSAQLSGVRCGYVGISRSRWFDDQQPDRIQVLLSLDKRHVLKAFPQTLVVVVVVIAIVLMSARTRELAIEYLLLLGRQQRPNLIVGLIDELLMLSAKICM